MLFNEIIGQQEVKQRLIASVKNTRISHAQLFLGPEGSGKLALAIAYAQYIACKQRGETDSCGKCSSCVKYQKLIHPDLHFVYPVVKTPKFKEPVSDDFLVPWRTFVLGSSYHNLSFWLDKIGTENLQGTIYAHESQEIIRKLNLKTYESIYKIMIIWMPEKMNAISANKLLKILEEPPPMTVFLLVAENSDEIISTILSRTQLIKIPKIENKDLETALLAKFSLEEQMLKSVVSLANGNYLKALEAINQSEDDQQNFNRFQLLMRLSYKPDMVKTQEWVEELSRIGREKQKSFLNYTMRLIRENFIINQIPIEHKELVYLNNAEYNFSLKFSTYINERNVLVIFNELNKACFHIERNAYGKLVFFDLILKIMQVIKK
jgi:DNA polymerase-3 subunit delta'